jgi:tetratricopeptide (TPR) repeat protein
VKRRKAVTAADCLFRSARDKLDEGDFNGALELAREGLLREEYHPGLLQVYGLAAYRLGEPLDALEGLEGASLVAPLDPLARLTLADLYARLGKRKSARAALVFLAEPGRCPTPLLPDLARLLGKVGMYRTALKVCQRLIAARSWYHPAHYGTAYYMAKLKMPAAKVERHLRAAHELAPTAIPYRVALAGALAKAGRYEEACELVRGVPSEAVCCPACLRRLGGAAEVAGDVELAMRLRDRLRAVLRTPRRGGGDCPE